MIAERRGSGWEALKERLEKKGAAVIREGGLDRGGTSASLKKKNRLGGEV